jgi:hypothetical protein
VNGWHGVCRGIIEWNWNGMESFGPPYCTCQRYAPHEQRHAAGMTGSARASPIQRSHRDHHSVLDHVVSSLSHLSFSFDRVPRAAPPCSVSFS